MGELHRLFGYRTELFTHDTVCVFSIHHAECFVYRCEPYFRLLFYRKRLEGDRIVRANLLTDLAVVVTPVLVEHDVRGAETVPSSLESRYLDDIVWTGSYALKAADAAPDKLFLINDSRGTKKAGLFWTVCDGEECSGNKADGEDGAVTDKISP